MISSIRVSNYKSLGKDVAIRFGRLTVLVGQNGAGKSNVVDVIRFVSDSLALGLDAAITKRGGIGALRRWGYGRPFNMTIDVEVSNSLGVGEWSLELSGENKGDYRVRREHGKFRGLSSAAEYEVKDGRWVSGPEGLMPRVDPQSVALQAVGGDQRLAPLARELRDCVVYSIFPDKLKELQAPDVARPMREHGENWCSVFRDVLKGDSRQEVLSVLGQVTGDIDDSYVRRVGNHLVAGFRHGGAVQPSGKARERWFSAVQESDGTLRVAGILTALTQEPLPVLVGIEEPELTLHPGVLPLLAEQLSDASRRCQVVVTTHSPDLLDRFDADHVRVLSRNQGVTTATRLDEGQRQAVRSKLFSLGELMRCEGLLSGEPDLFAPASLGGGSVPGE